MKQQLIVLTLLLGVSVVSHAVSTTDAPTQPQKSASSQETNNMGGGSGDDVDTLNEADPANDQDPEADERPYQ